MGVITGQTNYRELEMGFYHKGTNQGKSSNVGHGFGSPHISLSLPNIDFVFMWSLTTENVGHTHNESHTAGTLHVWDHLECFFEFSSEW